MNKIAIGRRVINLGTEFLARESSKERLESGVGNSMQLKQSLTTLLNIIFVPDSLVDGMKEMIAEALAAGATLLKVHRGLKIGLCSKARIRLASGPDAMPLGPIVQAYYVAIAEMTEGDATEPS